MTFPDLPEKLALLKMERTLKEEFDRRERACGRELIASGQVSKADIVRALGISRTNVDKRFGNDKMRDALNSHAREFQRRRSADARRLQRVKEAMTND